MLLPTSTSATARATLTELPLLGAPHSEGAVVPRSVGEPAAAPALAQSTLTLRPLPLLDSPTDDASATPRPARPHGESLTTSPWPAIHQTAADPSSSPETLRQLWHDLHFGPCHACGAHEEVGATYTYLQTNPATPSDLREVIPCFLATLELNPSLSPEDVYTHAAHADISAGIMRQLSWSPALPDTLWRRGVDDLPALRHSPWAPYAMVISPQISPWMFVRVLLDPAPDHATWEELDGDPTWFEQMARGNLRDEYASTWLEGGLPNKPIWRAKTVWQTLRHLPDAALCRAFDAPRGWLMALYEELRRHRHHVSRAMREDDVGAEPIHLTRLVAPLCLEPLAACHPTEPAQLVWKERWMGRDQQQDFEAHEGVLQEMSPEQRANAVLPAIDVMGQYVGETHEAIIYLPVVRSVARQLLLRRGIHRRHLFEHEIQEITDRLCLLVEIHELAHGLCDRGVALLDPPSSLPRETPAIVHELWAQELVRQVAQHHGYHELARLLDELSKGQGIEYRAYRLLDGLEENATWEALHLARRGALPEPVKAMVDRVLPRVKQWLAQVHADPEMARLKEALHTLTSPHHEDPLEMLAHYAAFVEALRVTALAPELSEDLPRPGSLHLHTLAQLVAWFPH